MVEVERRIRMEFEGIVTEDNKGRFVVDISPTHRAVCTLSGKIRQNQVRIMPGDRVTVECSEYSPDMGRIVYRHKG